MGTNLFVDDETLWNWILVALDHTVNVLNAELYILKGLIKKPFKLTLYLE